MCSAPILLPRFIPKPQACRILGDCPFGLVGDAGGEVGGDFEADGDGGLGVAGEEADDLFGDLHQAHFGGGRVDVDGTDEGMGFGCVAWCGCCGWPLPFASQRWIGIGCVRGIGETAIITGGGCGYDRCDLGGFVLFGGFWLDEEQGGVELDIGITKFEAVELILGLTIGCTKEVTAGCAFEDGLFECVAVFEAWEV